MLVNVQMNEQKNVIDRRLIKTDVVLGITRVLHFANFSLIFLSYSSFFFFLVC